jgi:hypothetical protein
MQHLSLVKVAKQSVTKFITKIFVNLVTPKAAPKLQPLFNETASKASYLSLSKQNNIV